MSAINRTYARRLPPKTISADLDAWNGLGTVEGYLPANPDASAETLQASYDAMVARQRQETETTAAQKAAADAARVAEWEFHNSVLAMKNSIRAQFGVDSDAAQSVGLKKKSEYKRPSRRPVPASV